MGFSDQLRKKSETIWRAQLRHPFVIALGNGSLPQRKFKYYILQDARFLGDLARVFAAAAQKAPDPESALRFAKLVEETIITERGLHESYGKRWKMTPAQMSSVPMAPTNFAYTRHMLTVAAHGSAAEITVVALPCAWIYCVVGHHLLRKGAPKPNHPYRDWLNLYASPERSRGDAPQPRADVYALGMLWYQLLVRNLEATRPGGSAWRRKLAEQGVTQAMLELLESCFEDNPADRPADAAALAERLHGMTPAAPAVATAVAEPELGVRPRSRRADVRKLFDTLEQAAPERQKLLSNSVGMKLVLIPAGTVAMGSPEAEAGRRINEGPQHEVALTRDFYFAVTLVTQKQFLDVMGHNPAKFSPGQGGDLENPVEYVTWLEATAFCQRLSAMPQEKQAGRKYRLPTEAEWEYACRAGTTTAFSFGAELGHGQANFDSRFPVGSRAGMPLQKPSRVASYPANHFGLYDIHGNVWEWCQDWFDSAYYARSPRRDPPGPEQGEFRVLRGGSWRNHAATCRSAYRNGMPPTSRDKYTGFRVVMELSA